MKKKNDLVIIILSVIIIGINNVSLSKYDYIANCNINSKIAKAIVVLEKDEIIKNQINQDSFPIEYNFSINNFNKELINEVDFDCIIHIESSTKNFPISYYLLDCDNNVEIKLIDGKSEPIKIKKFEKESKNFKLYIKWREIDMDLSDQVQLRLKIDVLQSKEEINEV